MNNFEANADGFTLSIVFIIVAMYWIINMVKTKEEVLLKYLEMLEQKF